MTWSVFRNPCLRVQGLPAPLCQLKSANLSSLSYDFRLEVAFGFFNVLVNLLENAGRLAIVLLKDTRGLIMSSILGSIWQFQCLQITWYIKYLPSCTTLVTLDAYGSMVHLHSYGGVKSRQRVLLTPTRRALRQQRKLFERLLACGTQRSHSGRS